MSVKKVTPVCRVRHNYKDGHGDGTVIETYVFDGRDKASVIFNTGKGPFPYLYAAAHPEIVPI